MFKVSGMHAKLIRIWRFYLYLIFAYTFVIQTHLLSASLITYHHVYVTTLVKSLIESRLLLSSENSLSLFKTGPQMFTLTKVSHSAKLDGWIERLSSNCTVFITIYCLLKVIPGFSKFCSKRLALSILETDHLEILQWIHKCIFMCAPIYVKAWIGEKELLKKIKIWRLQVKLAKLCPLSCCLKLFLATQFLISELDLQGKRREPFSTEYSWVKRDRALLYLSEFIIFSKNTPLPIEIWKNTHSFPISSATDLGNIMEAREEDGLAGRTKRKCICRKVSKW